jgi:hypothetical protein
VSRSDKEEYLNKRLDTPTKKLNITTIVIRSLFFTIFVSFVTCDVFTAQMGSGDLKTLDRVT